MAKQRRFAARRPLRPVGRSGGAFGVQSVTTKPHPGDFDACWDVQGVDEAALDAVFWDFSDGRSAQKRRFGGEFFPAQLPEGATGRAFVEFFQVNKRTGAAKGIVAIRLRGGRKR